MQFLKAGTAEVIMLGPAVDAGDGVTLESTLATAMDAASGIQISKNGGAFADRNGTPTTTVYDKGWYRVTLNATDTNTEGTLDVMYEDAATCLPMMARFQVVNANVYDSLMAAATTDYLQVDMLQIAGNATNATNVGTAGSNYSATRGLSGTALPAAAADAPGGLPISDAGGLDIDALNSNVSAILADTGTDGVAISASTINSIADQVWDEATADHVAAGSFGSRLSIIRSNTAQAGASTTITLDASASATNDFYNDTQISIVSGTGAGQTRFITDYDGSTKVATVSTWAVNPSSDSVFVIWGFGSLPGASAPTAAQVADAVWDEAYADHIASGSFGQALGGTILRTATAQAGGASSITLDASASATDDLYNYCIVRIIAGTGAGQSRQISDYNGTSKVATVGIAWAVQPSSDSVYQITSLGVDAATVASIADGVWDEARSGHVAAGSFGERVNANVTQISADTSAADNLEAALDGTGGVTISAAITGNITGNLSGSVGSVTGAVGSVTGAVGSVTGNVGGNVSGNVTGSVGSVLGGINTSAGVITTLDGLDTAQDTQHSTTQGLVTTVDTVVDAIKAKTDSLTFTISNVVDANIQRINDVAIVGDGSATPFNV